MSERPGPWPYPPPSVQPRQYAQPYPPPWRYPQYASPPAHWQAYRPLPYAAPSRPSNKGLFAGLATAGLVVLLLFSLLAVAVQRSVAAVAAGFSDTAGELDRAMGSRIVSYTGSSFYRPQHDPGYMFSHEMAHALVATIGPRSGARAPLYIVEGFARFMETRNHSARPFLRDPDLTSYLRKGFTGHLPTDGQLRSKADSVAGAAYELSLLVYLFIEHTFGSAKCLDLVNDAYEVPTADGGSAALAKATGMSLPAFEAQWVTYVHQQAD